MCSNTPVSSATVTQATVVGTVLDGVPCGLKNGSPDCTIESIAQVFDELLGEERGIIEFSLSGLYPPIFNAHIVLPVFSSKGPFPFAIDVFTYGLEIGRAYTKMAK
jgi:hypothetical protein